VGDIAYVASSFGPTFYSIAKVQVDEAGKVVALTFTESDHPAPIERITAVFANILNPTE
jgi:hypothetical protein